MGLTIRLLRASWYFGAIFVYFVVFWLVGRLFRAQKSNWYGKWRSSFEDWSAGRIYRGMVKLQGVFIKLGQVLSIMGGFLPERVTSELAKLQDAVPPRPFHVIERSVERSFGKKLGELFSSFEREPLAAASLGQVHRGKTHDGIDVAVKVLYPGIREIVRVDLRVVRLAIRAYKLFVPVENIESSHDALVDLLERETDYRHEAECITRFSEHFASEQDIISPEFIPELSNRDVLTMTLMEGIKIGDVAALENAGIDIKRLAHRLVESFYKQIFLHRFFHADPHPGNFLVQDGPSGPRIVVLDYGAMSEVDSKTVNGMVDILRGIFEQRDELVLDGIERVGFVAEGGDRGLLETTIKRYFKKLLTLEKRTPQALIDAKKEQVGKLIDPEIEREQLRVLMRSVRYPDGWFYVERAAILMFWLCARLDPDLDTMQIGVPYIMPLIAERVAAANA